jgi:hypothetical protein
MDRSEQDEDSSHSNRSKCDATTRTSNKMQDACADMETDPAAGRRRLTDAWAGLFVK